MFSNLKLESRLPTPSGTLSLVGPAGLSGNESTTLEILHADATLGALHALAARDSRKYVLSFDDSGARMCLFFPYLCCAKFKNYACCGKSEYPLSQMQTITLSILHKCYNHPYTQ